MSESRKIIVQKDNPIWQEYDREIAVELWHNASQCTVLRISPDEARDLHHQLDDYLKGIG
jgi:hypothetical protein